MLRSGLDPHRRTLAIATVDGEGRHVRAVQRPTRREAISASFAAAPGGPGARQAVVKSTSNGYGRRDPLGAQGVDLRIAHWKHLKAIRHATMATDAVDAATLAQRLRGDRVPDAHMVGSDRRAARDLLRARLPLVAPQGRVTNTITGSLAQERRRRRPRRSRPACSAASGGATSNSLAWASRPRGSRPS